MLLGIPNQNLLFFNQTTKDPPGRSSPPIHSDGFGSFPTKFRDLFRVLFEFAFRLYDGLAKAHVFFMFLQKAKQARGASGARVGGALLLLLLADYYSVTTTRRHSPLEHARIVATSSLSGSTRLQRHLHGVPGLRINGNVAFHPGDG